MKMMKASRIYGPNDMRYVDVPVPEVGPRDVLSRVVRAGVCGTDLAIYSGEFSFVKNGNIKFPMTPGHEWSGIVEKVGSEVTNFKPGDRVVGDTGVVCGECYHCLMGEQHRCKNNRSVGTVNTWDGAYGQYMLMPQRHLFHLPDNVSFDNAAMIEPAATALYAVRQAEVRIGDTVLVNGSGPIGIMAAKEAKLCGASLVMITGRKDFKLEAARKLGVDVAINTTKESLRDVVRKHCPDGVDRIVEASGSIQLFQESFDLIRPGGNISVVAFYEKMVPNFDIDKFVFTSATVRAVAGSLGMYKPVLNLLSSGMLDLTPLITSRRPHHEAGLALKDMQDRNDTRIKIMLEA
jgi:2-desacetyl-2-hydroxyethyl bacteriochlorophyllide A dehydrogenase